MKVKDWIQAHPGTALSVTPDASLDEVLDRLLAEPCLRDVWIVDDAGRVVGHLSHQRLAQLALGAHRRHRTRRQLMEQVAGGAARELMTEHFPHASPEEELDDVLHRQIEHGVEDMPVLDSAGVLLGAVNLTAVLRETRRAARSGDEPL